MLTQYIQAAMSRARVTWLTESHVFYGEIPDLPGVWATGETEDTARAELQEVLEDWITLGLRVRHRLPVLNGIDLNLQAVR